MRTDADHKSSADVMRLTIELLNICNLHCSYCVRDDHALYSKHSVFLPVTFLRRVIEEAKEVLKIQFVSFTGGEVTLHPSFGDVLQAVSDAGLVAGFVTNGWNFGRVQDHVLAHRKAVASIAFSLDGSTEVDHDFWRGKGSFARVIQAMLTCRLHDIPFSAKTVIRRDTMNNLESIALLAARIGASGIDFSHLLPTSLETERDSALSYSERKQAESEIATLASVLQMPVRLSVGFADERPEAPCSPLRGTDYNIDYRGFLSLCCNLSGFRGGDEETTVVADLNHESLASALPKIRALADRQLERRRLALVAAKSADGCRDLYTSSPCLFCLKSLGKVPWLTESPILPIFNGRTSQ